MKKVKVNYEFLVPTGRDFPAEWHEENGCYMCRCSQCGNMFYGRKRRVVCRDCLFKNMEQSLKEMETHISQIKRAEERLQKCQDHNRAMKQEITKRYGKDAFWDMYHTINERG